ncbi:hypothetical protein [Kitasatospora sp. NPDC094015]|uniref:three-helix bundle dimerization domain-containing protein n=1 Tax=Kitasatospora sp. NPDC094015 TaxID=3155205 RepID=UPI00331ED18C
MEQEPGAARLDTRGPGTQQLDVPDPDGPDPGAPQERQQDGGVPDAGAQDPAVQEDEALQAVGVRLHGRFDDAYGADAVERAVQTARHGFDGSPIRSFIPILVERQVIDRLRAAGAPRPTDAAAG